MHNPILIASPPRSGTTMIAGLLHHHGAWVGKAGVTKYKKTNSDFGSENIEIKRYLKMLLIGYKNWSVPLPDIKKAMKFKENILSLVNTDGPWLVKTSNILLTWQLWNEAFPQATWLFIDRSSEAVINSVLRHPRMGRRHIRKIEKFVMALQLRQRYVSQYVNNYMFVNVDEIIKTGDAEKVVTFCGLTYDPSIAENWIKQEMWHG